MARGGSSQLQSLESGHLEPLKHQRASGDSSSQPPAVWRHRCALAAVVALLVSRSKGGGAGDTPCAHTVCTVGTGYSQAPRAWAAAGSESEPCGAPCIWTVQDRVPTVCAPFCSRWRQAQRQAQVQVGERDAAPGRKQHLRRRAREGSVSRAAHCRVKTSNLLALILLLRASGTAFVAPSPLAGNGM